MSRFGALTSDQETVAQQTVDSLSSFCDQALASVLSSTSTWGAGNVQDAVVSNLNADKDRISRLGSDLLDQVRNGSITWDNWVSIAKTTHDDIAYNGNLTSQWSLTGVLSSTFDATAKDVGKDITTGPPTWMLLIGGGVLVVAGLYYLSPIINLVGSKRRSSK